MVSENRKRCIALLLFVGLCLPFALLVVRDVSQPLFGSGDLAQWGYTGFYFGENLRFTPFPSLDLLNDKVFYPYGVNNVLQPWGIEWNLLSAGLDKVFGRGPWLQLYYLATVLITACGAYLLMEKEFGFLKAMLTGFGSTFLNFYAINKYPDHFNYSVVHWQTLSILSDFLLVQKVFERKHVSLRFVLFKVCAMILSAGIDLNYITGIAIVSFLFSGLFVLVVLVVRKAREAQGFTDSFKGLMGIWRQEVLKDPASLVAIGTTAILGAFFYLPLALQIAREATGFPHISAGTSQWSSPWRIFIPYFPGFNPGSGFSLGDFPEGLGAGAVGWTLLIPGLLGLFQARKKIVMFLPLLGVLGLCLFYHPIQFPTLKIFPWFVYARGGSRFTCAYPAIFVAFATQATLKNRSHQVRNILLGLFALLAVTEIATAYSVKGSYAPWKPEATFYPFMETVRSHPGEAVLDWPFCIAGGNAVGTSRLGPFYGRNNYVYALRMFHGKKVVGQYFGRLDYSQIEPHLMAGWDKLFSPDTPDYMAATRQTRCFSEEEWKFFLEFFRLNDFAGINLYVDLLPDSCVAQFYERIGRPIAETRIPLAGRVVFIPKPPALRPFLDLEAGKKLKYLPALRTAVPGLLETDRPAHFSFTGIGDLSMQYGRPFRWALGPRSRILFRLEKAGMVELDLGVVTPIPNQTIRVTVNGVDYGDLFQFGEREGLQRRIRFRGNEGENEIRLSYRYWNHNGVVIAPFWSAPLAALIVHFQVIVL